MKGASFLLHFGYQRRVIALCVFFIIFFLKLVPGTAKVTGSETVNNFLIDVIVAVGNSFFSFTTFCYFQNMCVY